MEYHFSLSINYNFLCCFFCLCLIEVHIYFINLKYIDGSLFSTILYSTHQQCHYSHSKVPKMVLFCTVRTVCLGVRFRRIWVIHRVEHTWIQSMNFKCTRNVVPVNQPSIVVVINYHDTYDFNFYRIFFVSFIEESICSVRSNLTHCHLDQISRFWDIVSRNTCTNSRWCTIFSFRCVLDNLVWVNIGLLGIHHSVLNHRSPNHSTSKPENFGCRVRCGRFFRIDNLVYCNVHPNSGCLVSISHFYRVSVRVDSGSFKINFSKLVIENYILKIYFYLFSNSNSFYSY